MEPLARIARFVKQQGSVPAIQLAHAGRKASTMAPWLGGGPIPDPAEAWQTVAPSPIPFDKQYATPTELTVSDIRGVVSAFADAARRSLEAGFEIVELHGAHGYLLHQFLSPLSNHRTDEYGGSFENRIRFAVELTEAVRRVWPEQLPLFLRVSATDWAEGGWTPEESVELVRALTPLGVDLVDCSSGGVVPNVRIPVAPSYQVQFAERIRRETGVPTGAVGMITDPAQAEGIIAGESADLVILAREFLREPYWPIKAAEALGAVANIPVQYQRAFTR
jgi:2,4-dienoyl-CoA reductase-like NADH-dependent reductase (Old Yellow Enzyme family)